jgi:1,2-phenylacetyl-CoA epoxidase PaaB subunit
VADVDNSTVLLGTHRASVYQRQASFENHANVFSLHNKQARALIIVSRSLCLRTAEAVEFYVSIHT